MRRYRRSGVTGNSDMSTFSGDSASAIAFAMAAGEPIDTLVPSEVRKYIEAHRLYIPQP